VRRIGVENHIIRIGWNRADFYFESTRRTTPSSAKTRIYPVCPSLQSHLNALIAAHNRSRDRIQGPRPEKSTLEPTKRKEVLRFRSLNHGISFS
jgi:hypothetical protein